MRAGRWGRAAGSGGSTEDVLAEVVDVVVAATSRPARARSTFAWWSSSKASGVSMVVTVTAHRGPARGCTKLPWGDAAVDLPGTSGQHLRAPDARGCSSAVERQLPKLNVVGSIPITRSILLVRNERANARNTFLLQRLRRQMLVGFEHDRSRRRVPAASKSHVRQAECRAFVVFLHDLDARNTGSQWADSRSVFGERTKFRRRG